MTAVKHLAILLMLLFGPAWAHSKSQSDVSAHSRTAPVFFGYGAYWRRLLRDEYCRDQFNKRRHVRPDMPMGC